MRQIRVVLLLVAIVAVATSLYFVVSMRSANPTFTNISSSELHSMMVNKDFVLINVHTPYEGEIEGTDLFIPYDAISKNLDKLSADKNAKIVVYCMVDWMSAIAAEELTEIGYTNVLRLEGGMVVWKDNGYPLIQKE